MNDVSHSDLRRRGRNHGSGRVSEDPGTPASEGAVGPVNVVVGEGEVMACLDVRFLEVNYVRIPFRDEFAELLHSGSNAVGVP
ncbi:hypothetical protein TNCT_73451 [Trichonephila clavata]|uniref:Uncharacterized protein n=1 Tax=Trichonephila clavata TaxID=2740835 RepID=A0A8X6FV21_TRICU|nr:hypothetical protein TNCT_73451 [Trichonephila clavata]